MSPTPDHLMFEGISEAGTDASVSRDAVYDADDWEGILLEHIEPDDAEHVFVEPGSFGEEGDVGAWIETENLPPIRLEMMVY